MKNKKKYIFMVIMLLSGAVGYSVFIKKDTGTQALTDLMKNNPSQVQQIQQNPVLPNNASMNDDDRFLEEINQEKKKQILAKLKSETIKYQTDEKRSAKELTTFEIKTPATEMRLSSLPNDSLKMAAATINTPNIETKITPKKKLNVSLLAVNYTAKSATLLVDTHPVMVGEGDDVEDMQIKKIKKDSVILINEDKEITLHASWGQSAKKPTVGQPTLTPTPTGIVATTGGF